ncbi:hypothetical protein JXA85_02750 [Candidatus Woesearchaeota archaeon]|nr:hypothetical protein [Candidatus Woesearchaeota archaeon]
MRKAQMSEFLGIMMMVIVIVLFVVFNKLSMTSAQVQKAEEMGSDFENKNMWQGTNVLMMAKVDGMHMSELIGIMVCHNNDVLSLSENQKINISKLIIITLDDYYGESRWSLEMHESDNIGCISSQGYSIDERCSLPEYNDVKSFNFLFPLTCEINYGEGVIYVWK